MVYHRDGSERDWEKTGAVATHAVTTVDNAYHGIPGGKNVVLTMAFVENRKAWETAAQKGLDASVGITSTTTTSVGKGLLSRRFDMRKECKDDSGPFTLGVWHATKVECMRLALNLHTWHVLQNPDDFDYSLEWNDVVPGPGNKAGTSLSSS